MKTIRISDKAHEYLLKKAVGISIAQVLNNELNLNGKDEQNTLLEQIHVRFDALEDALQDLSKPRNDVMNMVPARTLSQEDGSDLW